MTAGGATGAECPVEESTTQPASTPGGAASPKTWPPSIPSAATSATATAGDTTPVAGETSVALPTQSSSGVRSSAEPEDSFD